MEEGSFDEVIQAARTGDHRAIELLYLKLAPGVVGYLRGEGWPEPEDLASEVFVGLVRNLSTFEGDERSFRSWAFSIAYRRLVDARRAAVRRREDPVDPAELAESVGLHQVGDVEEDALARLAEIRTAERLATLTPEQRAVLLLRVLGDLSVSDVGRIVGKTEGAVKSLQRRALLALARQFRSEAVSS
ncbi:MAG TPA: RNA polymerase sigma factor [Actinomycetota bacterium]